MTHQTLSTCLYPPQNEARWQELIEERNQEVMRMRATCSNMEDQNTTLLKRCEKLEGRNEELREAYNSIGLRI